MEQNGYSLGARTEVTARAVNGDAPATQEPLDARRRNYASGLEPEPGGAGSHSGLALEFSPFIEGVIRRWRWLLVAGVAVGVLAGWAGHRFLQTQYTAVALLLRQDPPTVADAFRPRTFSPYTLASLLRSPELLERVSAQTHPRRSADELAKSLRVTPERNSDLVSMAVSGTDPQSAIALANVAAREAVRYTREMQAAEAAQVRDQYQQQVARLERNRGELQVKLAALTEKGFAPDSLAGKAPVPPPLLAGRLETARVELVDLLARYTEAHPLVQAQRAKIKAIESQLSELASRAIGRASAGTNGIPVAGMAAQADDPETLLVRMQALEREHQSLSDRAWLIQAFAANPPGYCRLLAPATPQTAIKSGRTWKVAAVGLVGGIAGVFATFGLIFLLEMADDRLKSAADVQRVTGLPVLAVAADLKRMSSSDRADRACRIWTALQHRLSPSPNCGLVCGITSANPGEGRSTWISLLAQAASQRGFRVLTIATQPPANGAPSAGDHSAAAPPPDPGASQSRALTTNALAAPEEVAARLTQPDSEPLVHIPLPGWVWNLERRKQWQAALNRWRQIDNLVILVELPPASVPEAVLLGENLPNLIWLTDSGRAKATETRVQLATLRHARCRLAGAVLNRESGVSLAERFPRWMSHSEAVAGYVPAGGI